jgi:hypothetical protein
MLEKVPDEELTLEQIEGNSWGDPPLGATRLMATVHALRRKPIGALTAEDLRVLIAQQVGLGVVVPRGLARLEDNPLLEGDYYPGDVLVALLRVPTAYWLAHRQQLVQLETIIGSVEDADAELKRDIEAFRKRIASVDR